MNPEGNRTRNIAVCDTADVVSAAIRNRINRVSIVGCIGNSYRRRGACRAGVRNFVPYIFKRVKIPGCADRKGDRISNLLYIKIDCALLRICIKC